MSVTSGRFFALLNPSNYNGAALLHAVTNFRRIDTNRVHLTNRPIGRLPPFGQQIGAIFRDCTLFPRVDITRGVTFNLRVRNLSRGSVPRQISRVLTLIRVRRLTQHGPTRLSNNRRRQITLTQTLTPGPGILLLSRPLSTLSLGLHGRVRIRLGHIRGRTKVAFVFIARSRRRTLALSSHVTIVSTNGVLRVNAPGSVCRHPGRRFITRFVNSVGFLPNRLGHNRRGRGLFIPGNVPIRVPYPTRNFSNTTIRLTFHPRHSRLISPARPRRLHKIVRTILCINATALCRYHLGGSVGIVLHRGGRNLGHNHIINSHIAIGLPPRTYLLVRT